MKELELNSEVAIKAFSLIFFLGFAILFLGGFAGKSGSNFAALLGVTLIFVVTRLKLFSKEVAE